VTDDDDRERNLAFFLHRLHDVFANRRSSLRRRNKPYNRDFKPNRLDEWVCNDFPNCGCGRATGYPKSLRQYSAAGRGSIDCYVVLKCISNHVPDRNIRMDALGQLLHPKYDKYAGWL